MDIYRLAKRLHQAAIEFNPKNDASGILPILRLLADHLRQSFFIGAEVAPVSWSVDPDWRYKGWFALQPALKNRYPDVQHHDASYYKAVRTLVQELTAVKVRELTDEDRYAWYVFLCDAHHLVVAEILTLGEYAYRDIHR